MDLSLSKLQEMVKDRGADVLQSMGSQRVGHNWVTEQQQQWISLEVDFFFFPSSLQKKLNPDDILISEFEALNTETSQMLPRLLTYRIVN